MRYDDEYGSFKFTGLDMELILNALSYSHWNDRSLTQDERDYIDGLYQSLDNAGVSNIQSYSLT